MFKNPLQQVMLYFWRINSATHVVLCDKAARQLGSQAAKFFVGRHCGITDECPTRGASNEIHICDSNMNGSYEREVILRRYADNETKTLSVTETRKEFSLLGRERSRLSKANYGYERGEGLNKPF